MDIVIGGLIVEEEAAAVGLATVVGWRVLNGRQ
jgi:hypothetical protein